MPRNHLQVACAVVFDDQKRLLAVQRSATMALPMMWELPGGKIEPNEDAQTCIVREIKEELNLHLTVGESLPSVYFRYPEFDITLYPITGTISDWSTLTLAEHNAYILLAEEKYQDLNWAPADIPILNWIKSNML